MQLKTLGLRAVDWRWAGPILRHVLLTLFFQIFHVFPKLGKKMETLIEIPYKESEKERGRGREREREREGEKEEDIREVQTSQPINALGVGIGIL